MPPTANSELMELGRNPAVLVNTKALNCLTVSQSVIELLENQPQSDKECASLDYRVFFALLGCWKLEYWILKY